MAKKKVSRKELLKTPDEFMTLSARAVEFATRHQRHLQYVGIGICIVIVLYLAWNTYMRYVNKKGLAAYNEAHYALIESMRGEIKPGVFQRSGQQFYAVVDEHALSRAAKLALPQVAYAKFAEKNYDQAIELYEQFLEKVSGKKDYESLTHLALAACYEAKGDLKSAAESLTRITDRAEDPFREVAMISLARIHRLENRPHKEKEILKAFIQAYPASPYTPLAKAKM
jgi:outer membrane protein assembly factor BamD (BamD/ComL family)